jgi:hypothetical protein
MALDTNLTTNDPWFGQFQPVEDTTIQGGVLGPNGLPASGNTGVAGGMTGTVQQGSANFPPPPADWPQAWKDLYQATGGTGGINPPWLRQGGTVQPLPTGSTGQTWDQNYFATNFGTPKTPQELIALESKITAAGGKVLRNAAGVAGKIQTPDGRIIDVINSAGAGGNGFQWLEGPGGGQGSALAGLGYNFGDSMKPFGGQFALPTLDEFKSSPFYGAGLDAMMRTRQNSAASRGTLLNGRVNEALNNSALDYGLGQYGTLAGLSSGVFDRNYNIFKENQDRPFDKNVTLANLGAPK